MPRRRDRIGRAAGFPLDRKPDTRPLGRVGALVVVADEIVLGPDDQADVVAAGVGERAQDVIEERPAKRDHRLQSRVGDFRLRRIRGRALDPRVASGYLAAGEDEGLHARRLRTANRPRRR